jgi:hypothetical protein
MRRGNHLLIGTTKDRVHLIAPTNRKQRNIGNGKSPSQMFFLRVICVTLADLLKLLKTCPSSASKLRFGAIPDFVMVGSAFITHIQIRVRFGIVEFA